MTTVKERIEKIIKDEYTEELKRINLYERIRDILTPFEGKPISKRMANAISDALPDYYIDYSPSLMIFHLRVYTLNRRTQELSVLLGYTSDDKFKISNLDEYNTTYTMGKERNNQRLKLLDDKNYLNHLSAVITSVVMAKQELKTLTEVDNPSIHFILREFDLYE